MDETKVHREPYVAPTEDGEVCLACSSCDQAGFLVIIESFKKFRVIGFQCVLCGCFYPTTNQDLLENHTKTTRSGEDKEAGDGEL